MKKIAEITKDSEKTSSLLRVSGKKAQTKPD
jgi:hypothetical protein